MNECDTQTTKLVCPACGGSGGEYPTCTICGTLKVRKQTTFCCETMEFWSAPCDQHKDSLIYHTEKANMPGIRLFDSKGGFVVIVHCPWCGKQIFDDTGLGGMRVRRVSGTDA